MVDSKQKGTEFELKVAKMFSAWSGYDFHRTPSSGALHWLNDIRVVSDIVPSMELMQLGWPFSVECKKVEYDWDFASILEGTSMFWKHWAQCEGDAERENLTPMLVFSKNFRKTYAAMWRNTYSMLQLHRVNHLDVFLNGENLTIVNLEDLFSNLSCDMLLAIGLPKIS